MKCIKRLKKMSVYHPMSLFKKCTNNSPIRQRKYIPIRQKSYDFAQSSRQPCLSHKSPLLLQLPKPKSKINLNYDYDKETAILFGEEINETKLVSPKGSMNSHRQAISSIKLRIVNKQLDIQQPTHKESVSNHFTSPDRLTKRIFLSPIKINKKGASNLKLPKCSSFLPPIARTPKRTILSYYSYGSLSQRGFYYEQQTDKTNQDRLLLLHNILQIPNYSIFSVFDGHGQNGHFISELCKEYYKSYYTNSFLYYIPREYSNEQMRSLNGYITSEDIYNKISSNNYSFITKTIKELQQLIMKSEYEKAFSGTTMCQIIIAEKKLITINIGDSRAIMIKRQNRIIPLTKDHKPFDKNEMRRIESLGGEIKQGLGPLRVYVKGEDYPGIAMSRSLGDLVAKKIGVTDEPEIKEYEIDDDCLGIVLASDGIWDNLSNERVMEIFMKGFEEGTEKEVAETLASESRKIFLDKKENVDDISIVVVFINNKYEMFS